MPPYVVITLTEPWGTLVTLGAKKIETRSWQRTYRDRLLIHTSQDFPLWAKRLCLQEPFCSVLNKAGFYVYPSGAHNFKLGHIIGQTRLVDIERITPDNLPEEPERSFGDYTPGRFAWHLTDASRLAETVPATGARLLWKWAPPPHLAHLFAL